MLIKLEATIDDTEFSKMNETGDEQIIIDLQKRLFLTSKEISRLLMLTNNGKKITLINTNSHIEESIKVLKLGGVIKIESSS